MDGFGQIGKTFWGIYPSSNSDNADGDTLSEFSHQLRKTVSNVYLSRVQSPLFIRHQPSSKRSSGGGGDRKDPTEQLLTLNLNANYRKSLKGKNVVILDDCTTHGTSFGVAAALLHGAKVQTVTCVALGKFGNQTNEYVIEIKGDPFKPLTQNDFTVHSVSKCPGNTDHTAQKSLVNIIG